MALILGFSPHGFFSPPPPTFLPLLDPQTPPVSSLPSCWLRARALLKQERQVRELGLLVRADSLVLGNNPALEASTYHDRAPRETKPPNRNHIRHLSQGSRRG